MKIVVLDGGILNPGDISWAPLERLGEVAVYHNSLSPELVLERIGDAEIVLTNKTVLSGELLSKTNVKYIGVLATGYNVVDIPFCRERGIRVSNVPSYSTDSVAQHAFSLLLELTNSVGLHSSMVRKGEWEKREWCFWEKGIMELRGKKLGVLGWGQTGRRTAEIARAFGMEILPVAHRAEEGTVSVDRMLRESDVITLHAPLTEETRHFISDESISKMKDGVLVINTARGGLVDEDALYRGLVSGKIAGAAMDVTSTEPLSSTSPLLSHPSVIITPHTAWASKEARVRLMDGAAAALESFLGGGELYKVV